MPLLNFFSSFLSLVQNLEHLHLSYTCTLFTESCELLSDTALTQLQKGLQRYCISGIAKNATASKASVAVMLHDLLICEG